MKSYKSPNFRVHKVVVEGRHSFIYIELGLLFMLGWQSFDGDHMASKLKMFTLWPLQGVLANPGRKIGKDFSASVSQCVSL